MSRILREVTPRHRRIMKAARAGLPPVVIAQRFRTTAATISSTLTALRRMGYDIPRYQGDARAPVATVCLARDVASQFRRDAKRRGVAPRDLAASILTAVIQRKLVARLLDGGGRDE